MIEQVTFAEIEADPDFSILVDEYAAESRNRELPAPTIQPDIYRRLEAAGTLHIFAAKSESRLIGFLFLMVSVNGHGVWLAMTESIFVGKAHRMGGAGVKLLRAAKAKVAELGVPGLYVTAPKDSVLAETLPRLGFVKTNELFFMKTDAARIKPMTPQALGRVYDLQAAAFQEPQIPTPTLHTIHGGVYTRTVFLAAGTTLTGALIKIPATLIVQGDAQVYIEDGMIMPLRGGYNVIPASAGRKQAILAETDIHLTMIHRTEAQTVEEAEREFTDEVEILASRREPDFNHTVITGE